MHESEVLLGKRPVEPEPGPGAGLGHGVADVAEEDLDGVPGREPAQDEDDEGRPDDERDHRPQTPHEVARQDASKIPDRPGAGQGDHPRLPGPARLPPPASGRIVFLDLSHR